MQFIKLTSESARGKGWVRVVLRANNLSAAPQLYALERPGYREQFLGKNGWQVSSHYLQIDITNEAEHEIISFLMSPDAVQYMESGSNYQLTLLDFSGIIVGSCTLPWKGVPSYVKPKSKTSPLTTLTPQDPVGTNDETIGGGIWPISTDEHSPIVATDQKSVIPFGDSATELKILAPQFSAASEEPKPVFQIKCPHGDHKILSHMVFCPICSKPV